MNYPKVEKKSLMAGVGAVFALLQVIISTAPARAAIYDFNFQFNAQETGAPVSGDFLIDDSITTSMMSPDAGTIYLNASSKYTINVGKEVFQGGANSVGVAQNLTNPINGKGDSIFFDNLQNFNPANPKFLATFVYPPNTFSSNALSDLAKIPPQTAFALINTPTGLTLSSRNTVTKITAVSEPTSTFGIFTLCAVVAGSVLKRKQSSAGILATNK